MLEIPSVKETILEEKASKEPSEEAFGVVAKLKIGNDT